MCPSWMNIFSWERGDDEIYENAKTQMMMVTTVNVKKKKKMRRAETRGGISCSVRSPLISRVVGFQ